MWIKTKGAESYLRSPLYHDPRLVYTNLWGRELTVTAIDNWPFFKTAASLDGSPHPHSGIDVNILNTIANKLNFT